MSNTNEKILAKILSERLDRLFGRLHELSENEIGQDLNLNGDFEIDLQLPHSEEKINHGEISK